MKMSDSDYVVKVVLVLFLLVSLVVNFVVLMDLWTCQDAIVPSCNVVPFVIEKTNCSCPVVDCVEELKVQYDAIETLKEVLK